MIYKIKNILVAIDFSDSSINALKFAIDMAKRQHARLRLVNIIKTNPMIHVGTASANHNYKLEEMREAAYDRLLSYSFEIRNKFDILTHITCEIGNVETEINNIVAKDKTDLLVIGTHGVSGWKEFFLGSDAMNLIRSTYCTVLAIPSSSNKSFFNEIVFPVRVVEGVAQKYDYIKPIVNENGSNVHLLGIANEKEAYLMEKELDKIKDAISFTNTKYTVEKVITDKIAEEVLRITKERKADLLVINATIDPKWKAFFSGTYTQHIINHANIPVLCIKPTLTIEELAYEYFYLVAEPVFPLPKFILDS